MARVVFDMVHRCAQLSPLLCAVACGCARCVSVVLLVVALAAVLAVFRCCLGWSLCRCIAAWLVVALRVVVLLVAAAVLVAASVGDAASLVAGYCVRAMLRWLMLPCW